MIIKTTDQIQTIKYKLFLLNFLIVAFVSDLFICKSKY